MTEQDRPFADMPPRADPHRAADDGARSEARRILAAARDAVLAVMDMDSAPGGWPMTSRIGLQTDANGLPLALLSGLALHTAALSRNPRAALLIDAPAPVGPGTTPRGSALAKARLSLQVLAVPVADPAETETLRAMWRARDPKSAVYLSLPDFRFWRLVPQAGLLNAGFGQAWRLSGDDLKAVPTRA